MTWAVGDDLCNGLAAVTGGNAVWARLPERDIYRVVLSVPDMVRPLQVMRIDIYGYMATSAREVVESVRPFIRLVKDEREVRQWSQCDP